MDENIKKGITDLVKEKMSGYVEGKDVDWMWQAYFRKYHLKNRFNILIGIIFLVIAGFFLDAGTIPFIGGAIVLGLVGIKRLLDYDFSIEVSIMDEIINRFEK